MSEAQQRVEIRTSSVDELAAAPNIDALLSEYASESAMPELGSIIKNLDGYKAVEASGVLHVLSAVRDGVLVGFLAFLVFPVLHYGRLAASTESFFVSKAARKSGAGLRLLAEAERLAKQLGAAVFFVSAPAGSRLVKVMGGIGYRNSNLIFAKGLA